MTNSDGAVQIPLRALNRLGLSFCLDSCLVIDLTEGVGSDALFRLLGDSGDGWINLSVTDTVGTEVRPGTANALSSLIARYDLVLPEVLGPAVLDHSRWDHSVWANEDDDERLEQVWRCLKPNQRDLPRSKRKKNDLRDAMHVATAIRYGFKGLLTRDEDLLGASECFKSISPAFQVLRPSACLRIVEGAKKAYGIDRGRFPETDQLPSTEHGISGSVTTAGDQVVCDTDRKEDGSCA